MDEHQRKKKVTKNEHESMKRANRQLVVLRASLDPTTCIQMLV